MSADEPTVVSPVEQAGTARATASGGRRESGRNIILLSDGTGNSASSTTKTNVWRLYEALDLEDGTQIAYYDDGVGTSSIQFLRLIGGALGFGLAQNVRDLYRFLCENYRPPTPDYEGDRIFLFGFSRGAYTVRLLTGLITRCGLLDRSKTVRVGKEEYPINSREGMPIAVGRAYRSMRREFEPAILARVFRFFEDVFRRDKVQSAEAFRATHCHPGDEPIEVLGVWDTVAAYGMPIDELSDVIDRVIVKHRFDDHTLSPKVGRAVHALAIDDERRSFHPLLFQETNDPRPERIKQVWFAGMHADVGGGYADDQLARVPLTWMIDEVAESDVNPRGLRFRPTAVRAYRATASATAPMHNSRAGLGLYYRLAPRIIDDLRTRGGVMFDEARIHSSVFERIASGVGGYVPLGVPLRYVDDPVTAEGPNRFESATQKAARGGFQDRLLDHVFWRRVMYYLSIATTAALLGVGYFGRDASPEHELPWPLGYFVPDFATLLMIGWFELWPYAIGLFGFLWWISKRSTFIKDVTFRLAEHGWVHVKAWHGSAPLGLAEPGFYKKVARRIRSNAFLKKLQVFVSQTLIPWGALIASGVALVVGTLLVLEHYGWIERLPFD